MFCYDNKRSVFDVEGDFVIKFTRPSAKQTGFRKEPPNRFIRDYFPQVEYCLTYGHNIIKSKSKQRPGRMFVDSLPRKMFWYNKQFVYFIKYVDKKGNPYVVKETVVQPVMWPGLDLTHMYLLKSLDLKSYV